LPVIKVYTDLLGYSNMTKLIAIKFM